MKCFTLYRPNVPDTHTPDQKAPPDQPQLEGVVFTDGTCVLRWCTTPSTSVWASFEDMAKIHGHPEYGTYFVWHAIAMEAAKPARPERARPKARARPEGIAQGDAA